MDLRDENHIAEAWIEEMRLPDEDQDAPSGSLSAFGILYDFVQSDPEKAWRIIQILWRLDSSDEMLANIAAGPVEDILAKHGPKFIDRVETVARQEPIFKKMLGAVWGRNRMADDVWARLKAVAGPR